MSGRRRVRLVGREQCTRCGAMQSSCYLADGEQPAECAFCGEMATFPVGPQYPSAVMAPGAHADAVIDDLLETRHAKAVRRAMA